VFEPGSSESVTYLDQHGYVILKETLTGKEAEKTLSLLWDYLEDLGTGIDRKDPQTWEDDRWPTSAHGGILPSYGIGHSESQWFLRSIPNVKKAFAKIWGTDELLTSFDGVSLWRPWNINPSWKTESGQSWFHIDQHPITRPGKQCIQGLVNLLPTSQDIGGNVVVPGSHRFFKNIPSEYKERLAKLPLGIDHFRFPNGNLASLSLYSEGIFLKKRWEPGTTTLPPMSCEVGKRFTSPCMHCFPGLVIGC
jgi:hypothetical protein